MERIDQYLFALIGIAVSAIGAIAAIAATLKTRSRAITATAIVVLAVSLVVFAFALGKLRSRPATPAIEHAAAAESVPSGTSITATPAPRAPIIEHRGSIDYALIRGKALTMGCSDAEPECDDTDLTTRRVEPRPFWLMTTEVTWEQYRECIEAQVCRDNRKFRPATAAEPPALSPVNIVSAHDAETFCEWIGARLPNEDEWEFAARAGEEKAQTPWEANVMPFSAVVFGRSLEVGPGLVRTGPPNVYGVFDLYGNLSEWCTSVDGDTEIVVKGGSYNSDISDFRFAARAPSARTYVSETIGVRCAVDSK